MKNKASILGIITIAILALVFNYSRAMTLTTDEYKELTEEQTLGASVLRVVQGGTGASSFTSGECLIGNGTGAITTQACGAGGGGTTINYLSDVSDVSTSTLADGYILKWNDSSQEWQSTSTLQTFFYEQATSTNNQTVFDLNTFTYDTGDNELEVFVNGVYQIIGDSYVETDSDTVTFNTGLNTGDRVVFAVRGGIVDAGGGSQLTEEQVEDYIGGMVTGNTETDITVTYQDDDGTLDFVVTGGTGGWTFSTTTLDYWFDNTSGITRLTPYVTQAYGSSTYAIAGGAYHDGFSDFVANEHIDWTQDQGATNIHAGNYTDTTLDLSSAETITGNWVNTTNPWADNEVSDTLTVTGYMQDTDIDTFAELQSWAVGYTDNDTTYTAGDALTLDGTEFDFDGGASPGGELGGTWASPTLDHDALDDQYYDSEADLTGLLDDNYEGELDNEAGLYSALSDVSQFYEPSDNMAIGNATSTGIMVITDGTYGFKFIPGATSTMQVF